MLKKKRKTRKKVYTKVKLPPNACFWFDVSTRREQIEAFVDRGNEQQRKNIKAIIDYRLWQIQEGAIAKDFFGDLDVKKLDFDITIVKRKARVVKTKKETIKKPIDLFDITNIEDLVV